MKAFKFDFHNTVKGIEWQYLVSRRDSLFGRSLHDNSNRYFHTVANLPVHEKYQLRLAEGEIFTSKRVRKRMADAIYKGGLPWLRDFRVRLIKTVGGYGKTAQLLEDQDFSQLTQIQLYSRLKSYVEAAWQAASFLNPLPIADEFLSQMILERLPAADPSTKQQWLGILTFPSRENAHIKEERDFYNLALAYQKNKKIYPQKLAKHVRRYAWIGARGYRWYLAWTVEDVQARVNDLIAQRKNPATELRQLDNLRKIQVKAATKLLNGLNIKKSSELYRIIKLAQEYAYLRTWRTDVIYSAGYYARNMFAEIAKRAGLTLDHLMYHTVFETLEMSKTGKPILTIGEIGKRKQYFATLYINKKYYVVSGRQWKNKLQYLRRPYTNKNTELKGNCAYQGLVVGPAKVVLSGDDLAKVKRGDVLVAVMTFPNFVPAMEKAAAFVTDEGGILCHAAIVSREMEKPCIIATKHATKVLKDGDLVEVDANRGIVKKLKSS